jgi:hypothetical protein
MVELGYTWTTEDGFHELSCLFLTMKSTSSPASRIRSIHYVPLFFHDPSHSPRIIYFSFRPHRNYEPHLPNRDLLSPRTALLRSSYSVHSFFVIFIWNIFSFSFISPCIFVDAMPPRMEGWLGISNVSTVRYKVRNRIFGALVGTESYVESRDYVDELGVEASMVWLTWPSNNSRLHHHYTHPAYVRVLRIPLTSMHQVEPVLIHFGPVHIGDHRYRTPDRHYSSSR